MAGSVARVSPEGSVPPRAGSELALDTLQLESGSSSALGTPDRDTLLFVFVGSGSLTLRGQTYTLSAGSAALVLAGEESELAAGLDGCAAIRAAVGPDVDPHAPLGPRETVVAIERVAAGSATGKRSFQVLFGPHNGSTRATLFAGFIPPGRAPWHYHLYDEIVWIWRGAGRVHLAAEVEPLAHGSAFRLSPRELHIVENASSDEELAVLGLFTPAGSPSAAYLAEPADAAAYAIEAAP